MSKIISQAHKVMTLVACESKLRPVMKSSMYQCPGNWVAIGRAVVYHAQSAARLVQELTVGTASVQAAGVAAAITHGEFHNLARGRVLCTACHAFSAGIKCRHCISTSCRSSSNYSWGVPQSGAQSCIMHSLPFSAGIRCRHCCAQY